MRRETSGIVAMTGFAVLAIPIQMLLGAAVVPSPAGPAGFDSASVRRAYSTLPLAFEENRGQVASTARFVARGSGYAFLVDPLGATLEFTPGARRGKGGVRPAAAPPPVDVMRIDLVGADPDARAATAAPAGRASSFTGDGSRWRTGVPVHERVGFRGVYPGIDVVYHGAQGSLEYDFVVAPGADPRRIRLRVGGGPAAPVPGGGVALALTAGTAVQHPATAFQPAPPPHRHAATVPAASRSQAALPRRRGAPPQEPLPPTVPVGGGLVLGGGGGLHLALGDYDRTRPLVVDPVVTWSPAVGGGLDDTFVSTVDGDGAAYTVSATPSPDVASGAGAASDVAVLKLDPAGRVVYRTLLGGADPGTLDLATGAGGVLEISGTAAPAPAGPALVASGPGRRVTVRLDARGLPLPQTGDTH